MIKCYTVECSDNFRPNTENSRPFIRSTEFSNCVNILFGSSWGHQLSCHREISIIIFLGFGNRDVIILRGITFSTQLFILVVFQRTGVRVLLPYNMHYTVLNILHGIQIWGMTRVSGISMMQRKTCFIFYSHFYFRPSKENSNFEDIVLGLLVPYLYWLKENWKQDDARSFSSKI